ncbi:nucleoporin NUP42-like [Daphnia carinata]|uniref:nucleoporin NUP42-like n=1 Tax=Daphnia carinata TaxID=120202 RepID=UPI00257ECE02|nr:nucleoporin NUP42-like [Daphnia carinata]
MVVCKFFLEGRCRFGANCKNEHTQSRIGNAYQQQSFNQPVRQQYFPQQQKLRESQQQETNLESLLYVVKDDATNSMQGGQWLFSCYAPLLRKFSKISFNKNEENLPSLVDYSPEELKWEAMHSSMNGQFHDYTVKLQKLSENYQTIQRALQNLDQATSNYIVRYERGENVSPTGTALGNFVLSFPAVNTTSNSPSQFSFTLPSTQNPIMAPSQQLQTAVTPFKFQLPSQQSAEASFSFHLPPQQPAATSFSFILPSQQPQSVINTAVTKEPNAITRQIPVSAVPNIAENVSHHQLSQIDLEQFKADKFTFGKIPRIPPPIELR